MKSQKRAGSRIMGKDPIVLNLGCGNDLLPDCINVDIVKPKTIPEGVKFVQDDVIELSFLRNRSVDGILANFILEHIHIDKIGFALYKWNRVLVGSGSLEFVVPNFDKIVDFYNKEVRDNLGKTAMYNEFRKINYHLLNPGEDAHRSLWNENLVKLSLPMEGFEVQSISSEGFREFYLKVVAKKVTGS